MSSAEPITAAEVRWDLSTVFASDAQAASELDQLAADCGSFARALPDLTTIAAPALAAVMVELGSLKHRTRRMRAFAELRAAEDSRDGAASDLGSLIEQRLPEIDDALRGFTLAWLALPDQLAAALAGSPELGRERHYLISCRRFAPHTLRVGEERALAARSSGAELAWRRFWFDVSSALTMACDLGDG
ncbi:MAG: oligoendopeptidase, partial [Gaiellales bacterium]|nr:oligoendopeptidase [Gaiellales bacterium]